MRTADSPRPFKLIINITILSRLFLQILIVCLVLFPGLVFAQDDCSTGGSTVLELCLENDILQKRIRELEEMCAMKEELHEARAEKAARKRAQMMKRVSKVDEKQDAIEKIRSNSFPLSFWEKLLIKRSKPLTRSKVREFLGVPGKVLEPGPVAKTSDEKWIYPARVVLEHGNSANWDLILIFDIDFLLRIEAQDPEVKERGPKGATMRSIVNQKGEGKGRERHVYDPRKK